jgi:hypothetical protein
MKKAKGKYNSCDYGEGRQNANITEEKTKWGLKGRVKKFKSLV